MADIIEHENHNAGTLGHVVANDGTTGPGQTGYGCTHDEPLHGTRPGRPGTRGCPDGRGRVAAAVAGTTQSQSTRTSTSGG
ncbi:hypothetical protein FRAAL6611 [Frankia alni ACN14a]|uniref:Uncharacterized protein n=1 Tax=Frankia alni (strain DSM 45986 / CECT 9034 / ACN14a) TaxID=326424 RepID=Q0RBF2_FRAAA|nr:hypothetical protein FRAAL6611 [Frankia alni ACN14a]